MKKWIILVWLILPVSVLAVEFPEIEGWKPIDEVNVHRKDDLWKYIDGAAELFLTYDFQMLRFREFSKGDMEMVVEIYDMASALNAFGIYSTERGDDVKRLSIGTEAVIELPYYCQLLKDRFYVKVKMLQGELDRPSADTILGSVDSFIKGASSFPDELNLLPVKSKIAGTEKYVAKGYKGMGDVNHVLFADYQDAGGSKFRYFLMLPSSDETVNDQWQHFSGKWNSITDKGHPILYKDIPYSGKIGIVRKGKRIIGVTNVTETDDMLKRLRDVL